MQSHRICYRALALLVFGLSAQASAQSLIWRTDWTMQAPPTFEFVYSGAYLPYQQQAPFVFSSDGELVMRVPSIVQQDDQIVRFTAGGAVRWSANIGNLGSSYDPAYGAMLASADGSAYVTTAAAINLVKIGADGAVKWSEAADVRMLAPLTNQAVAVLGCSNISALDAQTGQLLWRHTFPSPGRCAASGLISDAAGNVYVTASTFADSSAAITGFKVLKFNINGQLLWQQSGQGASLMPFGVSASRVYVTPQFSYSGTLQAFAVSDGTPVWSASGAVGLCVAGIPAEAIVSTANGVQRLADADGQPRWTQPGVSGNFASAKGNRIIVANAALDASTGQVLWTAALPNTDRYGNYVPYLTSGALTDGSVLFAGKAYFNPSPPLLQRVDSASGQLLGQIAVLPTQQSVVSNSVLADAHTIAASAILPSPVGPQMRLRALDADGGTLRWEKTEQFDVSVSWPSYNGIVAAGNNIAVSVTESYALWVGAFDRASGSKLWDALLYNYMTGQGQTTAYDPLADSDGNVFVSYGTTVPCAPSGSCSQLSVVKLHAADGSIAWQHDELFQTRGLEAYPYRITVVGPDLFVAGRFTGANAGSTVLKLSGADGSLAWASNIFYQSNALNGAAGAIYAIPDGNIIVTGNGWAKLDVKNGATIWSNPNSYTCVGVCYNYSATVTPDGSLVFAGEDNHRTLVTLLPATAGAASVNWHPDQADTNATRTFGGVTNLDSAGGLWMRVGRHYGPSEIVYLGKFDLSTGTFVRQQALAVTSNDPLLPYISPIMLAAPENNRFPANIDVNNPPQPFLSGHALVDSTVSANGNLSIQITADHAYVQPGQLLGFHLIANYSGDAPITGAKLLADFPWTGFATGLACTTQLATNCQIDSRASTAVVSFDIKPGGQIDVSGSIRVTDSSIAPKLRALVAGPINLNELSATDNAAALVVDQSIFADGFQ